jgi:hypothetical protein
MVWFCLLAVFPNTFNQLSFKALFDQQPRNGFKDLSPYCLSLLKWPLPLLWLSKLKLKLTWLLTLLLTLIPFCQADAVAAKADQKRSV